MFPLHRYLPCGERDFALPRFACCLNLLLITPRTVLFVQKEVVLILLFATIFRPSSRRLFSPRTHWRRMEFFALQTERGSILEPQSKMTRLRLRGELYPSFPDTPTREGT